MSEPTEAGLRRAARRQGLVRPSPAPGPHRPAHGAWTLAPAGMAANPAAVGAVLVGAIGTSVTGEPMTVDDVAEALHVV